MLDEENNIFIHNDKIIKLGREQTELLGYLIERRYKRTSTQQLSMHLYGVPLDPLLKNAIATRVWRLNRKLKGIIKIAGEHSKGYKIQYNVK